MLTARETEIIRISKPQIMVEVSPSVLKLKEDRDRVLGFFDMIDYSKYVLVNGSLIEPGEDELEKYTNFICIPSLN